MSNDAMQEIILPLDERNLAHVLSAVTLAAMAVPKIEVATNTPTCRWDDRGFVLRTAMDRENLFTVADHFVRSIAWVPGIGTAEQGTFTAGEIVGSNPFISLRDDGQERSPFKTFSGKLNPGKDLLDKQRGKLVPPDASDSWIFQVSRDTASWGYDCRVGSHAYDLGFSSNDEGSGSLDPIYTAVELMSIAAASFFAAVHAWQCDESTVLYSVWNQPVSASLVPYASAGLLSGLEARRYKATNRGAAYGKGAAYRFFPESTIQS